jgi:hypothetical protein
MLLENTTFWELAILKTVTEANSNRLHKADAPAPYLREQIQFPKQCVL